MLCDLFQSHHGPVEWVHPDDVRQAGSRKPIAWVSSASFVDDDHDCCFIVVGAHIIQVCHLANEQQTFGLIRKTTRHAPSSSHNRTDTPLRFFEQKLSRELVNGLERDASSRLWCERRRLLALSASKMYVLRIVKLYPVSSSQDQN